MPFHLLKHNMPKSELTFIPDLASPRDFHITIIGILRSMFLGQVWYIRRREWGQRDKLRGLYLVTKTRLHSDLQTWCFGFIWKDQRGLSLDQR